MKSIRVFASSAFLVVAFVATGCIRKVTVPELLPVKAQISTAELVERINAYSETSSFAAQTEISVRDYFTDRADKAKDFPAASGLIRFQRPERVRMLVTFLGKQIADMTSNGQEFRLAVLFPTDKRVFVHGSNLKEYQRLAADELKVASDPSLREAGALANIRPQHITDAFIIRPITNDGRTDFFREEARLTEPDDRPGKKGHLVGRTYYVLYVLERDGGGRVYLRRKFWFDRTQQGTPLVRQQTFENGEGKLGSDVTYSGFFRAPNSDRLWAEEINIERRNDGYGIKMRLERDSVEVNLNLPSTTFVLQNTERLREVNLDEPRKNPVMSTRAP